MQLWSLILKAYMENSQYSRTYPGGVLAAHVLGYGEQAKPWLSMALKSNLISI